MDSGTSSHAKRRSKKEEQGFIAASNQENDFLNMDNLSMSMIFDMVDLGGTLAIGQTSRIGKKRVQSYFHEECGPANVVQNDINYWLKYRGNKEMESMNVLFIAFRDDYFLSLKSLIFDRSMGNDFVVACFKYAISYANLKVMKLILANFEIEKKTFLGFDRWTGLAGACENEGPNSLAVIDLLCRTFAISKEELLKYGSGQTTFAVMKYLFEHFDLLTDDSDECRRWRASCLFYCCEAHDLERLKYLVECVGVTAAVEGRLEPVRPACSNGIALSCPKTFVQYYVNSLKMNVVDFRDCKGLTRVRHLETAKWIIQHFNLNGDDVRANGSEALCTAADFNAKLLEYYVVDFGITEEELRNGGVYENIICWALDGDFSSLEWIRTHWSIRPADLNSFEFRLYQYFEQYLREFACSGPDCLKNKDTSKFLYLIEKLGFNIPFYEIRRVTEARIGSLIKEGWLRLAKCITDSWFRDFDVVIDDDFNSKLTKMITMAARRGNFAIVKYFIEKGRYELPSFIYLHHNHTKLKLSREICEKLVQEADTNVEFDDGLTDQRVEELKAELNSSNSSEQDDDFISDYSDDDCVSSADYDEDDSYDAHRHFEDDFYDDAEEDFFDGFDDGGDEFEEDGYY